MKFRRDIPRPQFGFVGFQMNCVYNSAAPYLAKLGLPECVLVESGRVLGQGGGANLMGCIAYDSA